MRKYVLVLAGLCLLSANGNVTGLILKRGTRPEVNLKKVK